VSAGVGSLFLSPHLDDAILSCALKILQERQAGRSVTVATVCSKALPLPGPFDLYAGRRKEEERALSILGVENPIMLGFQDAPFRNLFYHNFERVIMREHQGDQVHARALAAKVSALVSDLNPSVIYLPLAVGTHIDHRHTHRLWKALPESARIVFYEDRPYSLLPYNLELRLLDLGVSFEGGSLAQSMSTGQTQGLVSFAAGLKTVTMYKNVLTSKRQRFRYLLSQARIIQRQKREKPLAMRPDIVRTNSTDEASKIKAAVGAYQSQISMLFKDMDTFSTESASYNTGLDGSALYSERYWTLIR
jgi:LmbE family N-acetylglucosaminyl deacetylase